MKGYEHGRTDQQSRKHAHRTATARMRASDQYNNKSAAKFPATRNSVESNTPPITTYKSRARIASLKNGPSPGQPINASTTSDPLRRVPRLKPKSAMSGCAAAGSA